MDTGGIKFYETGTNKGWECPKCGQVWSPTTDGCRECNQPPRYVWGVDPGVEDDVFTTPVTPRPVTPRAVWSSLYNE